MNPLRDHAAVIRLFLGLLTVVVIVFTNRSAHAQDQVCDSQIVESVGKYFDIENFNSSDENGVIVASVCKTWPYRDNVDIAAFAYRPDAQEKKEGEDYKNLLLVTLDKKSRRIIASYRDTIVEDVVTDVDENSLHLDTARYQLSKDLRAFGLQFNSSIWGVSCSNRTFENELTLFVQKGSELRPVFKQFIHVERVSAGCIESSVVDNVLESASLSIAIEKTASHGYADLKINAAIEATSETIKAREDGEPPAKTSKVETRVESYLLHFNGKAYVHDKQAPWWITIRE